MTKPRTQNFTYLKEGKYTFVLTDVENRSKEMPEPNFKGTGKALMAIMVDCEAKHDGRRTEAKKNHRWSVVDESLIGTCKII